MSDRATDGRSIILTTVVRAAYPAMLAFAAFLFLRGHNHPGGGFIAGLMTAAAIVLRYVSNGRDREAEHEDFFVNLIAAGLAVALLTAAAPMALGLPFFTSAFGHFHVPLIGDVELASAALFDLGVYMVVVGNVITVLRALTDTPEERG